MERSHVDLLRYTWRDPVSGTERRICRLGLATRGDSNLRAEDVQFAIERGISFLNWCGQPDAMSEAVATLGARRRDVFVCVQFEARTANEARTELGQILSVLGTDYVDAITYYYVEEEPEWSRVAGPGGAHEYCRAAIRNGQIRAIGVTTHQRPLAAAMVQSGLLDFLMIRYNAAHRRAETKVFPITDSLGIPVVVYTCLRWGALIRATPVDPPNFIVPRAPAWYRFALQSPSVAVALMAPNDRAELAEDLTVLDHPEPLTPEEFARLAEHGMLVRRHAGHFP